MYIGTIRTKVNSGKEWSFKMILEKKPFGWEDSLQRKFDEKGVMISKAKIKLYVLDIQSIKSC